MTVEEAKKIINIEEMIFDIEDTCFGDGSVTVSPARVFDTKEEADLFVQALKMLCS